MELIDFSSGNGTDKITKLIECLDEDSCELSPPLTAKVDTLVQFTDLLVDFINVLADFETDAEKEAELRSDVCHC